LFILLYSCSCCVGCEHQQVLRWPDAFGAGEAGGGSGRLILLAKWWISEWWILESKHKTWTEAFFTCMTYIIHTIILFLQWCYVRIIWLIIHVVMYVMLLEMVVLWGVRGAKQWRFWNYYCKMPSNNYFREQHDIMHYHYFILKLIMNSNILRTRASNPHYLASNTANITYIRTSLRRSVRTLNNALCHSQTRICDACNSCSQQYTICIQHIYI